jgi:large subunit ribosomal protein L32
MAVPKKKISSSRRGMRRAHDKLKPVNIVYDRETGEPKLSHHISMVDGKYNGRQVFVPNVKNPSAENEEQGEDSKSA